MKRTRNHDLRIDLQINNLQFSFAKLQLRWKRYLVSSTKLPGKLAHLRKLKSQLYCTPGIATRAMPLSITQLWTEPSFGLIFHNSAPSDVVVAIKVDYRWWLTPIIRTQATTPILSIHEGATIEWRAISFLACSMYNHVNRTHYSLDDLGAFEQDDLVQWQGQVIVSFGMLGRTSQIVLL